MGALLAPSGGRQKQDPEETRGAKEAKVDIHRAWLREGAVHKQEKEVGRQGMEPLRPTSSKPNSLTGSSGAEAELISSRFLIHSVKIHFSRQSTRQFCTKVQPLERKTALLVLEAGNQSRAALL